MEDVVFDGFAHAEIDGAEESGGVGAASAEAAFIGDVLGEVDLERGDRDHFADQAKGFGEGVIWGKIGPIAGDFVLSGG